MLTCRNALICCDMKRSCKASVGNIWPNHGMVLHASTIQYLQYTRKLMLGKLWNESWENVLSDMCSQRRPSLLIVLHTKKCVQWRFWSDCANALADLNLRLDHMSECTSSHIEALEVCTDEASRLGSYKHHQVTFFIYFFTPPLHPILPLGHPPWIQSIREVACTKL